MIVKKKLCEGCGEMKYPYKAQGRLRYCQSCWFKIKPPKKPKPVSDKRKEENKEYSIKRIKFLLENPNCKARIQGICTGVATEVHHQAGRENDLLLDERYWLPSCRGCHDWCTEFSNEAIELGLSISKHKVKQNDEEGTDTAEGAQRGIET